MLNEFRTQQIRWDKATRKFYDTVQANASDSNGRKLHVQITDDGMVEDLTGATLSLYWESRDGKNKGLDALEAVDVSKGEFELFYTTGMLSNVGRLNAALVLVDSTGKTVSDWFTISNIRGIDEDAIENSNEFSALTQALIKINDLEDNYAPRLNEVTAQLAQKANQLNLNLSNEKIDETNRRIDEIITTPAEGISEQEIIDARQSEASLGANLTKIKDSIYVSSENLIANPLFQNSSEKWTPTRSVIESSGGVASMTSNAGTTNSLIHTDIPISIGEKIYFLIRIKPVYSGVSIIRIQALRHGDAVTEQIDNPTIGEEHTLSLIAEKTTDTYDYVRLVSYSIYGELSEDTHTVDITKPIALNLTRIFGVGKEPTKEEMDSLIDVLPIDFWEDGLEIDTLDMFNQFINTASLDDYMATENESWAG